jgi:phosphatidylserine/phosphatidylglycerophosphate/cardiolipin synthase-like enzyme
MSINVKVYDNGDHTCIVWVPSDEKPIVGCRGFTIQSKRTRAGQPSTNYCHGFVGFSATDKFDPANPWKFPVQRFLWWDYSVQIGDVVQYTVIPVIRDANNNLQLDNDHASPTTPPMTITGQATDHISAFFNKGIVASQWVSRALDNPAYKNQKIKQIVKKAGDPLRNALSGLLRPQIVDLLQKTKAAKGKIYAALYELDDPDLLEGLKAFGKDCNLVLANGAFKPPDNDENKEIRATLKPIINVYDRLVGSPHFGHNKFVVFCDSDGKPKTVLTGSTNWTTSGLCTQANNGLIIDDPGVAQDYLDAWNRIHAAGNTYPPNLAAANSNSNTHTVDNCKVTPWFVPTRHAEDLDYARKLINNAKEGILFLFFNPGTFQPATDPEKWTLLQNILQRHQDNNAYYNPNLYIKGVVNQEIAGLTEDAKAGKKPQTGSMDPTVPAPAPVALYNGGKEPPQRLGHDVLVPANIKKQFANWEQELLGASMVNIHSKVIVLDPFGENPVVMTGSHNLGFKASSENDDNLAIVEGNAPLAAAYAINIVAIFQAYRWNSYVAHNQGNPEMWHGLVDNDQWQTTYLEGDSLKEIHFWLGDLSAVPPSPPAAATAQAPAAPTAPTKAVPGTTPPPVGPTGTAQAAAAPAPHARSHRVAHSVAVRGHRPPRGTKGAKSDATAKKKGPATGAKHRKTPAKGKKK